MRRLKSINVFFDPSNTSVEEIENIPNLKDLVYGELLSAFEEAKNENKDTISLFELNNSGYIVELSKEEFTPALKKAMAHYETKEDYERCVTLRNLIEQKYEQRNKPNTTSNKQSVKRKNPIKKAKSKKSSS